MARNTRSPDTRVNLVQQRIERGFLVLFEVFLDILREFEEYDRPEDGEVETSNIGRRAVNPVAGYERKGMR